MKYMKNSGIRSLLALVVLVLAGLIGSAVASPGHAKAVSASESPKHLGEICQLPQGGQSNLEPKSGANYYIKTEILDRAHIQVTLDSSYDCRTPGKKLNIIYGTYDITPDVTGVYTDGSTTDTIFQYVGGREGSHVLIDAKRFGEAFGTAINDPNKPLDNKDPLGLATFTPSQLNTLLSNIELKIKVDENKPAPALSNGLCENDESFFRGPGDTSALYYDTVNKSWMCHISALGAKDPYDFTGLRIFNTITGKENFNTVLRYDDGLKALVPVDDSKSTKFTFTKCPDASDSVYGSQECSGGLFINESASKLASIGTGTAKYAVYPTEQDAQNLKNKLSYSVTVAGDKNVTGAAVDAGSGGGTSAGNDATPTLSCHVGYNPLNWLICGIIKGFVSIVGVLDSLINNLLSVGSTGSDIADPSQIFGSSTSTGQYSGVSASQHDNSKRFKAAWTSFRNIALGLMVLAGLAIVISQALGSEIVDAYTVRKVLPRLLIAAIGISLSWILCQFFVKFSNELGYGIRSLIYQPFADLHPTLNLTGGGSGAASVAITLIGSEAIYSLGVFGLLSFAGTAALAVSIAVLILVLRQIVIIILIIASPIAIVAYILPNTQKIYKLWYESFSKSLLMFPIIAAFIAGGRVFSAVAINSDPHGPTGALYQFVGFVAYFAPYFLIPFAFKFAGGALGTLAGATHERGKGAFGKLSQFRGNQKKQRRADLASRAQSGNVFKHSGPDGFRAKANTRIQQGTNLNKLGYSPSRWKNNLRAAGAVEENEHVAKAAEHSNAFRTIMDSDDYVEAAMKGNYADAKAHLISKGYTNEDAETGASLVRQAQEDLGYDTLAVASAIANAGAGTSYIGGAGEMFDSIMKASHGNMAVAVPALAQARKRAEGAGRRDLLADGFAESIGAMQQIDSLTGVARTDKIKEVNKAAAKGAIEKQGIGAVLSGRGQSGANMVDALNARMQDAHANLANTIQGSPPQLKMKDGSFRKMTLDEAQRNFTQVMASTSAALDQSGAAAPEIQRLLADTIYNGKLETSTLSADIQKTLQTPVYNTKANGEIIKDINGIPQIDRYEMPTEITAGELMAKMESMTEFAQIKKVYGNQLQSQMGQGGMQQPGTQPPIGPQPGVGP